MSSAAPGSIISRKFHVVERDPRLQGHGALRRGRGREVDRIGERLAARGWTTRKLWAGMVRHGAEEREARRRPLRRGPATSRRDHYCARATTTTPASRFLPAGGEKLGIYRTALRCYQEGLKRRHRNIEFVEVPTKARRSRRIS